MVDKSGTPVLLVTIPRAAVTHATGSAQSTGALPVTSAEPIEVSTNIFTSTLSFVHGRWKG